MTTPPDSSTGACLQELLDRQDIQELINRFARGVDRNDLALARSVYHPGALDHHVGFDGTAEAFMDWLAPRMPRLSVLQHLMCNHMAEIRGDFAVAETYGVIVRRGEPAENPELNSTAGFRYVDTLERRNGRWGITERWVIREWQRTDVGSLQPKTSAGPETRRDGDDILYHAMKSLQGR